MLKELPKKVPEMDILDYEILMLIKDMAAGMTKKEILDTFSIEVEDFSKDEEIFFNEFYSFGKGMAIHKVVTNLVDSTKGRQGQAAAMSFLRRFASEFESEIEGDKNGSFSFTFGNPS